MLGVTVGFADAGLKSNHEFTGVYCGGFWVTLNANGG
jgi:hypothetical protein